MGGTETKSLTEEEIIAIVTRELPRLVSEHPEIREKFVDVMSDVFGKKSDQAVLFSELKILRQDFKAEMKALREDFQIEINTSREEFQTEMKALREEFQAEIKTLREESDRRFEEHSQEMKALREESDRRFEEYFQEMKALREDFQTSREGFEAELKALREDMQSGFKALDNKIVGLGARWGIMSEETFRSGLKGILADELGLKVEQY